MKIIQNGCVFLAPGNPITVRARTAARHVAAAAATTWPQRN
jgi:hypothetical protein